MDDLIFRRNLLALSARSPALGEKLMEAVSDPRLVLEKARSGLAVPVLRLPGREIAFHSLVDPAREAERLVGASATGGFIVALGLGAAYAIKASLAEAGTSAVLAVEYSAPLLRALLEALDLSEVFLDPRFSLLLDPKPAELEAAILSRYIPPISGDIRTLPLRARTDLDQASFQAAAETLRSVLGRISDDYSVQAFFGKLWFRNAVRNLFASERPSPPLTPIRRAVVTAAGPSLEEGIDAVVRAKREGAFLIATDTSLPALLGRDILPSAVISIDCQTISYYHFLKGLPPDLPLVLDLASPNRLARLTDCLRFFSSGHPFCTYVSSHYRPFPRLDTSGGNVTHAALSLAETLGASSCLLVGADFSYPEGKSYARGTYIYDYFDELATRLAPMESQFAAFVRRNPSLSREEDRTAEGRDYYRYVTKPLMAYHEHLKRFIERSPMDVTPLRGKGVAIATRTGKATGAARREGERILFAAGRASESASSFLGRYAKGLAALPEPRGSASTYLSSLDPKERDLWTTLLPSAAALQRTAGGQTGDPAGLLSETRSWALLEIDEALETRRELV
jgi:hypothetical protein